MKEQALRSVLQRLGIQVVGKNNQRHTGKVWLNFRCPLAPYSEKHNYMADRHPSAGAVVDEKGRASRWLCYACKAHGTIYELAHRLQTLEANPSIPYQTIAEEIIDTEASGLENIQFGQDVQTHDPLPQPLIEEAYDGLWPDAWDVFDARFYLESRGISRAASYHMGLLYDGERHRVLFPVRHIDGGLYGYSGRAISPTTKPRILDYEGLPKRHLILGCHAWQKGKPVILVEGLFAYAHLIEIGTDEIANVGAILGSVMTPEKAELVKSFDHPTYLLMDADEAGDACVFGPLVDGRPDHSRSAIAMLRPHVPVFVPNYPANKDDPDTLTLADIQDMLDQTLPYGVDPVQNVVR